MICECQAAIADSAKFCPKCGKKVTEPAGPVEPAEPLRDAKKCPQCGAENPATAKFCKKDGAPLNTAFPNQFADPALPTPRTRKSISLALVGGLAALIIAAVGVAFFYVSGGGQSGPARAIDARPAEKDPGEKGLAESNQTIKGLAQPLPENRPQSESRPSLPPQPDIAATGPQALQNPRPQPEPQASSQAPLEPGISQPIQESRPQSEPQPASEAPAELAGSPPQTIPESGAAPESRPIPEAPATLANVEPQPLPESSRPLPESLAAAEPQPPLEASDKLANAAPKLLPEPPPFAEPLVAQPTPEAPLPSAEPFPESSPPPASAPAEPEAPATAKKLATPKIATMQNQLNTALQQRGLNGVRAKVIDKQTVALSGTVKSAEEKASAGEVAASASGMKNIRNQVKVAAADPAPFDFPKPGTTSKLEEPAIEQVAIAKRDAAAPDPARLEGEINRALREGGVSGVNAQINGDFSATLRGAARSPGEKEKAFQIARQFPAVRDVKDQIFVVEE